MPTVNLKKKQIECKIVFYGPPRCGKTTNLLNIHQNFPSLESGPITSINTKSDKIVYFDFIPLNFEQIKGCDIVVQLYTISGVTRYDSTRKLLLHNADGVIFVADSMAMQREKNMLMLRDLQKNLREFNSSIFKIPLVLEYNKRDLEGSELPLMPVKQMELELNNQLKGPSFSISALTGQGISEAFTVALELVSTALQTKIR